MISWPNKNPIGVLYLGAYQYVSLTNPNGWNPAITNPDGSTNPAKLIAYITAAYVNAKAQGCQSLIIWDIEGYSQQNLTYVGDPNVIFDPIVGAKLDGIFALAKEHGMTAGVTVRPTTVIKTLSSGYVQCEVQAGGVTQLINKIQRIQKNWPIINTFYIDSNTSLVYPSTNNVIPGIVASNVLTNCPNILPIWELWEPQLWGWGAAYIAPNNPTSWATFTNNQSTLYAITDWTVSATQRALVNAAYANGTAIKLVHL
jgi:hypothetical protein